MRRALTSPRPHIRFRCSSNTLSLRYQNTTVSMMSVSDLTQVMQLCLWTWRRGAAAIRELIIESLIAVTTRTRSKKVSSLEFNLHKWLSLLQPDKLYNYSNKIKLCSLKEHMKAHNAIWSRSRPPQPLQISFPMVQNLLAHSNSNSLH